MKSCYDAHGFVLGEVELDEIPPNHCAFKPPEQVPSFQATQGEKKGEKMERKREVAASGKRERDGTQNQAREKRIRKRKRERGGGEKEGQSLYTLSNPPPDRPPPGGLYVIVI